MKSNELQTPFLTSTAPVMLEIWTKAGDCWAFPYPSLEYIRYNPSIGISLVFSFHRLLISGRNLRPLYAALAEQKVSSIQENEAKYDNAPDHVLFVSRIDVISREQASELSPEQESAV